MPAALRLIQRGESVAGRFGRYGTLHGIVDRQYRARDLEPD